MSAALSTSVSVSVPVAVGVPAMPLADAARLDHRADRRAGDHRRVVGAVDGDGDDLVAVPSAVRTVKVSVVLSPTLSAWTVALLLSSV